MMTHIDINNDWNYVNNFREEMIKKSFDESNMETVRIPHANVVTPFHYFDEQIYQFVSCYRKHVVAKEEWKGKRILVTFEGVGHVARVYFNETLITTHYGGYTAFTVDLAPYVRYNYFIQNEDSVVLHDNVLVVEVDSRENQNLPPFGHVIDYLTYGGIYREVYLDIKETVYIEDVFVNTNDKDEQLPQQEKKLELLISLHGELSENIILKYFIQRYEKEETDTPTSNPVLFKSTASISQKVTKIRESISGAENWDLEYPILYELRLELWEVKTGQEKRLDEKTIRFGFRTCEFREDGFYLNHKKIKLLGLNRHQSFPYVGYAMPKRMQQKDAEILKKELLVNAVRTSHYPQSKHFINRCDELGLLVFTEIPGWQHIGDDRWKEIACDHVREMVTQYQNHPAIILWGVRINESQDDDVFYKKTNQIAHELDPTRQTGGVRYLKKSSLLEDVYTYNDFLHNGTTKGLMMKRDVTSNENAPYMVTEFNGHMFPTKPFDNEEHRLAHALRHACVLDALFEQERIAGGFGWCMFDYNTHKDFGSGDKICYHGVLDMFRNPKLAAAVYASQSNEENVFDVSSSMDIGEYPGGSVGDIYAFTNADSVRLYKNDKFIKEFYPADSNYNHLPHPPITLDDFVGDLMEEREHFSHKTALKIKEVLFAIRKYGQDNLPFKYRYQMALIMMKNKLGMSEGIRLYNEYIGNWGESSTTYRFEAVKNNQVVKVIEKKAVNKPRLVIITDTTELIEEATYDVTGIRIAAVDESGNRLYYYQEPVTLETWGAVELIGPKTVSLKGGAAGTYVRTKGVKGDGGLRIYQEDLGETVIKFQVK